MARLPLISPSLLSADFSRLEAEIKDVERAGADWLHVDVMDGHFVPNLTFGPPIVKAISNSASVPLDVHLMISNADDYLEHYVKAGASTLTVHAEATPHLQRTLSRIRSLGASAGVALSPATHESALEYLWADIDLVLVMTVNPGFGGQSFLEPQLEKLSRIAKRREALAADFKIQVDGGVTADNVRSVVDLGADVVVAGSAIFGRPDRSAAISALRDACAR